MYTKTISWAQLSFIRRLESVLAGKIGPLGPEIIWHLTKKNLRDKDLVLVPHILRIRMSHRKSSMRVPKKYAQLMENSNSDETINA